MPRTKKDGSPAAEMVTVTKRLASFHANGGTGDQAKDEMVSDAISDYNNAETASAAARKRLTNLLVAFGF
jgi:hypothetical protein